MHDRTCGHLHGSLGGFLLVAGTSGGVVQKHLIGYTIETFLVEEAMIDRLGLLDESRPPFPRWLTPSDAYA